MQRIDVTAVCPLGDMSYRAIRGFSRLESSIYQPENIRETEGWNDWPGDWSGRALLGVVLLSLATGRESAYAEDILETILSLRNEKGYLGKVETEMIFDEQQFSGHSWLLRALLSYYQWKKDPRAKEMADSIVNNLYLPATGYYKTYPMSPDEHVFYGEKSGTVTGSVFNHWRTSSDTGCAFICLDGLAEYYLMTRDDRVLTLLREMIDAFMQIDFVELSMQTHASLSATRGIVKLCRVIDEPRYMQFAESLFALYLDCGATVNYANYNWFRRAEWTEPCAIIDSYILAFDLFCLTKEEQYLKAANRIRYNAMEFAQRFNGGFGCDICVGPEVSILTSSPSDDRICEAYWCCTMRGGEGLSAVIGNSYLKEDDTLVIAQYDNSRLCVDGLTVRQKTTFPEEGNVCLHIDRTGDAFAKVALYVPSYAQNVQVTVNGVPQSVAVCDNFVTLPLADGETAVCLTFAIPLGTEPCIGKMTKPGAYSFWHGDRMLGVETTEPITLPGTDVSAEDWQIAGTEYRLTDLRGNINMPLGSGPLTKSVQVMFL